MTRNVSFVREEAEKYSVHEGSIVHQYVTRKTKASERDSKARRSLGNLYALYVLCADYLNGNEEGSTFTDLMRKMKSLPFGSKLQNHPLDNRLNDEIRRQYDAPDDMLPVQPADVGGGRKARRISIPLLSENGMNPKRTAAYVVAAIDKYIKIIDDNQTAYLTELETSRTEIETVTIIKKAFEPNSDARLFEVVSFALLHLHYLQIEATLTIDGESETGKLHLYKTGRTNANDGGIDFVLKPLGKFYQVTETLDFKKYFLDFDKINRFKLSFVIKTARKSTEVRTQIENDAKRTLTPSLVDKYIELFDEIFTLNELQSILDWVQTSPELLAHAKAIIIENFRLEYGLLD